MKAVVSKVATARLTTQTESKGLEPPSGNGVGIPSRGSVLHGSSDAQAGNALILTTQVAPGVRVDPASHMMHAHAHRQRSPRFSHGMAGVIAALL